MKCPKCDYLGFETGDRCKNCGYDFSLMDGASQADASQAPGPDLLLRDDDPLAGAPAWLEHLDHFDREPTPVSVPLPELPADPMPAPMSYPIEEPQTPSVAFRAPRPRVIELSLPFNPDDDAPLVKLPATPRPPLAVRRTPDTPRLRAVPKSSRRSGAEAAAKADEPVLAFTEEPPAPDPAPELVERRTRVPYPWRALAGAESSPPGRRVAAAAIDHAILLVIDGIVIYFTLRLAALTVGDWRALPPVPLAIFLGLVKTAYFCVFTLLGGQTIGKMAARIRVIADDDRPLDPARAIRRTLAAAISLPTAGLGFLPALVASDRRALHDRLARTRVVALRNAAEAFR